MNILERIDYGFFERISYFNELLPFTKIKIIMFFSMGIIATISFILIFKFNFPNIKNKYFILPAILFLTSGIILSYLSFPPNNYLMIYPKIKDSQKVYKYGKNNYLLEDIEGNIYFVEDGHLRLKEPVEE